MLSESERSQLAASAESGNGDAAFRLYQYHQFVLIDSEGAERWLDVARHLGHEKAELIYIRMKSRVK